MSGVARRRNAGEFGSGAAPDGGIDGCVRCC